MKLVPELNMRTTRRSHRYSLYNICVLSFFFFLLCSTFNRAGGDMTAIHTSPSASSQSKFSGRTRRHNHNVRHKMQQESHHRPLTEVQKADQNLQYMLSLYKSAADPDGRPKHHRKFGSNTVRLLRPSTTKMRSLTASTDLRYTYTVEYDLHPLTLDQLVRASFVHLRSSSTPHRSPLRCRVRVTSPGNDSWTNLPVGLEDHEGWDGVLRFRTRGRHVSRRAASGNHLNAPALLLFFDEEEEPREWGATSRTAAGRKPPGSIVSDIPDYSGAPNSSPKNQCKLYSYRVTFAALGMAHYVAPPQYNPHYCKGDCPRVLHYGLNPSNHAIMQTMIKGKGVAEVPSPSCVPYRYKPMSVLVLLEDNKTVDYKEIEDMIAESCTCR
uniref:TGF-beta family profile domain-containing protein n=1 Tax=Esox lucius TaxID=8010 RepID=A0A3P8Y6A3_ESOLU